MELIKIWEILLRRKNVIIIVLSSFVGAMILGTLFATPVYKASVKVLLWPSSDPQTALLGAMGLKNSNITTSSSGDDDYETEIELAQIRPVINEMISIVGLKDGDGNLLDADEITSGIPFKKTFLAEPCITMKQVGSSMLVNIDAYSTDAKEAADMANNLAALYRKSKVELTKRDFGVAKEIMQGKIQRVKNEYLAQLDKLKEFQLKEKIVSVDDEIERLDQEYNELKNELEENERNIEETKKKIEIKEKKFKEVPQFRVENKTLSQNELIKSLKSDLTDLYISMATLGIDITKEHPEYKTLVKKAEEISSLMKKESAMILQSEQMSLDPVYDTLYSDLMNAYINLEYALFVRKVVQKYLNMYEDRLMSILQKNAYYKILNADLAIYKETYQTLLGYLSEVNVAEEMALSNIVIVEEADIPDEKYFPKKLLNLILGLVLGSFFGVVSALVVEHIDDTIRSPEDLRSKWDLPVLGTAVYSGLIKKSNIIANLRGEEEASVVDSLRMVRNNIGFEIEKGSVKSIAVMSRLPSEGKSTIASNIAMLFAAEGRKVLLMEMNFLNPSIADFFGVFQGKGISSLVAGEADLNEVIVNSSEKGLDLMVSGPSPMSPAGIVEGEKLKEVLDEVSKQYDLVVIDTPAIEGYSNALRIGKISDAVVQIVESGRVSFKEFERIRQMLERASVNILGVILNKCKEH